MAKKILIIEGDVALAERLQLKLIDEGYDVFLEKDGALALAKIAELMPDLLLLDVVLPNLDGYKILEAKLKDPAIQAVPVIAISNSEQMVEAKRILALGALDYVLKSNLRMEDILEKIHVHLIHEKTKNNMPDDKLAGKKILWVEDDPFLSDIISKKISKYECHMMHAKSGDEAFQMLETEIPDIIVLDILLPGLNGFEILEKIKQNEKWKAVPVILLSNLDQKSDLDRGASLGAAKFLVKALYTLDEIIEQIREVLAKK